MGFDEEYLKIKSVVKNELDSVENKISNLFEKKNPLEVKLAEFLVSSPKRLRPLIGILFLRAIFPQVSQAQLEAFVAVELIHNATLIHDDVIDNAEFRRKKESVNCQFDNNLAVVAGDFLLSIAMEKIINLNSVDVMKLCTTSLKKTCVGEINQYFNKYKITTLDEYIQKSEEKTALLFEVSVLSGILLADSNEEQIQVATEFAKNFGIAFQIRDDLINFLSEDSAIKKDFSDGIYTAPIIFAHEENSSILESENIFAAIKNTKAIEKTKVLMDNYFNKSILALGNLDNNIYRNSLLSLNGLLREGF